MAGIRTDISKYYDNHTITGRIIRAMMNKGIHSKHELANITGVPASTLTTSIPKNTWSTKNLMKIASKLGVSVEYLVKGEIDDNQNNLHLVKQKDTGVDIPIYGMAICGMPVSDWSEPKDHISVGFAKGLNNAFAVKASGFSMSQTIIPGDIVFAYKSNVKPKNGSIVLVSMKTVPDAKEGLIKRIKWLPKKQIMLYSDNSRNNEPMVVDESDVYEIFTVHSQIIRQLK